MILKRARTCLAAGFFVTASLMAGCQSRVSGDTPPAPAPIATTRTGEVEGRLENGIAAYLNIPYAAAPVGELRWRAPQPPEPWAGLRPAREYGAICPQPDARARPARTRLEQSEDCLNLNVWAPAGASDLPVLVWIHGGAHIMGSGNFPVYDGAALAGQGLVVVTLNHRVGLLGYFAHPALTREAGPDAPVGNYALMDQVMALEWVRDNIAAFGGDPGNVTLAGQSAGGVAINYLLTLEPASGLFHKAIIQSGGGWRNSPDIGQAEQFGLSVATAAGLDADAGLDAIRRLGVEEILALQPTLTGVAFGPFIDGRLVKTEPWRAISAGDAHDVPMIIGSTSNDASVLERMGVGAEVVNSVLGQSPDSLRPLYADAAPDEDEFTRQLLNDVFFAAPARWSAKQLQDGAPVFLYRFEYVAERLRRRLPGANHSSEIPYLFGSWEGLGPLAALATGNDRAFGRDFSRCWTSFARTGAPNCFETEWPAYRVVDDAAMILAETPQIARQGHAGRLDELESIFVNRDPADRP